MKEYKKEFMTFLNTEKLPGIHNPYFDSGYQLRVMDTLHEFPTKRCLQGVHFEFFSSHVEIRFKRASLITATDLICFFLGQYATNPNFTFYSSETEVFKFLVKELDEGRVKITMNWEHHEGYIPCLCYLFYPVFSVLPDSYYFEKAWELTQKEEEVVFT